MIFIYLIGSLISALMMLMIIKLSENSISKIDILAIISAAILSWFGVLILLIFWALMIWKLVK